MTKSAQKVTATSGVNTVQSLSIPITNRSKRLVAVLVRYSAVVTVSVTITYDSGSGTAFDTIIQTIALSAAQNAVWIPDASFALASDDTILVNAPAGGAGITSSITIVYEDL